MTSSVSIFKPSVCFEVQNIIGIATNDGNSKIYQVQWAPTWISGHQLVGCEQLIHQFEHQQTGEHVQVQESVVQIDENLVNQLQDITSLAETRNIEVTVQDVRSLAERKNEDNTTLEDKFVNNDSFGGLQIKQEIQDVSDIQIVNTNAVVNTNTVTPESSIQLNQGNYQTSVQHNQSNISAKVSSLNSVIQNINRSNSEHVSRITVHPDFNNLNTNNCNVDNRNRHQQSNMQVCNTRLEEDQRTRGGGWEASGGNRDKEGKRFEESMVLVTETLDFVPSMVDQRNTRNANAMQRHANLIHEIDGKANVNARTGTKGGESSASSSEVKVFSCRHCTETFTDMDKFLLHIKFHRTVNGNPLECPYCAKRFSNISYLKEHTRVHTGERPFKCHVCQRCFSFKTNLKRHFNTHHKV